MKRLAQALAVFVALGGALLAAPAQATPGSVLSKVAFEDGCAGTTVTVTTSKTSGPYDWSVTVDGEAFWPQEGDTPLGKNATLELAVPAGAGEIVVSGPPAVLGWPKAHTWTQPDDCPAPSTTFEDTCHFVKVYLANGDEATGWAEFTINGIGSIKLAPGLTPEPLVFGVLDTPLLVEEAVTGQSWEHEWVKPEDCDGTPAPTPGVTPTAPPASGTGGDSPTLPATGSVTLLLGAGGVVLLVVGFALLLVARARRQRLYFE